MIPIKLNVDKSFDPTEAKIVKNVGYASLVSHFSIILFQLRGVLLVL